MSGHEKLVAHWDRRAQELCGSTDFYKETTWIRFDSKGRDSNFGTPAIYGMAYCNTKFVDTRNQNREENYLQYINLPYDAILYKEISPLWDMLMDKRYAELQEEVDTLYEKLEEKELARLLYTFSRINPAAEEYLTEWVELYPDSFLALYSRSLFYHTYSWFKRGSRLWKDVTPIQRTGLATYRQFALDDLTMSMELNSEFCPSFDLNLRIHTSISKSMGAAYGELFRAAKRNCPDSVGLRQTYLRYLLPRWGGSMEKMREFIDESIAESKHFEVLEAFYLAEEGDQFLFKGMYEQALERYSEAIAFGAFSSIYHQRGVALEHLNRYVEALEDFETAVALAPYYDSAYEGLTRILLKQNNLVGALIASSYLATMNNQNAKNFEQQGYVFYLMRRYDDALVSFNKAAILLPQKAELRHRVRMTEFQIDVRKENINRNRVETAI